LCGAARDLRFEVGKEGAMHLRTLVATGLATLAVSGCDRTKSDESSTTMTTGAGIPTLDLVASAENASAIARPSDEVPLVPTTSKLLHLTTSVRAAPRAPDRVAELGQGSEVTEIARSRDYYLVLFIEPYRQRKLAGWVHRDAVDDSTAVGLSSALVNGPYTCGEGTVRVRTDHDFCAPACREDADCKSLGGICDGNGTLVGTPPSARIQYCIVR
jgi:hypothetical protein